MIAKWNSVHVDYASSPGVVFGRHSGLLSNMATFLEGTGIRLTSHRIPCIRDGKSELPVQERGSLQ